MHNVKYNISFGEPPIAVSKFLNLAGLLCTDPQKCDRSL